MEPTLGSAATFSHCGAYRYSLTRRLGKEGDVAGRYCVFIMLNPSTADHAADDPTIRRCIGFARRLECTRLKVVNLYARKATKPTDLVDAPDPVGEGNDDAIGFSLVYEKYVIAAWGAFPYDHMPGGRDRANAVAMAIRANGNKLWCLGTTKHGFPCHPLYLPKETPLEEYTL